MRLIAAFVLIVLLGLIGWFWWSGGFALLTWRAAQQQHVLQNALAAAISRVRAGDVGAFGAVLLACLGCGFFHAADPGHGKAVIGGAALASRASAQRMSGLALSASFGQALTAMLLVYGGFSLFEMTARQASFAAVKVFAPASFAAIGLIGLYLIWRGLRSLWVQPATRSDHHHDHTGHDHKHGPSVADANAVDSWRAAIGLVASISVRPCTGAIFVLVICWQLGLNLLGMASVLAMATGTAAFTILVAVLAVGARRASFFASADSFAVRLVAPTLQVFVGFAIAALASVMLSASLG